jgi:hypothetical protein
MLHFEKGADFVVSLIDVIISKKSIDVAISNSHPVAFH